MLTVEFDGLIPPGEPEVLITTSTNDIKERLSIGVVTLVAARAGCEVNELKVDRESIDVTIRPVSGPPVAIDAQLKSSSGLTREDGHILLDLPVKNYNDLRSEVVGIARILIVLDLIDDEDHWVSVADETLITKRLAYWIDLYGAEATTNTTRKRVRIPLAQRFTPETLRLIMQRRYDNLVAQQGGVS